MATLKNRRSKYYARIRIWANDIRKETEKQMYLDILINFSHIKRKEKDTFYSVFLFWIPRCYSDHNIPLSAS